MAYKGLFIGIDKYESQEINWLSCARRDATALYALFKDNLGDDSTLLVDTDATRRNILNCLEELKNTKTDDIVIVAYSGHGSETHEIVAYDSDPNLLKDTGIQLIELGKIFESIPARQVILILDCCFSGEIGSKVLKVDAIPRCIDSTDKVISQISGEGRIILTASSPTEEAWESASFNHGLLSYHLLEGLQGAKEVLQDGKTSFLKLVDYVTLRVSNSAKVLGKIQTPSIKGNIISRIDWPIFVKGEHYSKYFPQYGLDPVTESIDSLEKYGFPSDLINKLRVSIPKLNELQIEAINNYGIFSGKNLVVSAPTSSGKTLIGELVAVQASLLHKRAVFLLPLKALVNEKHLDFQKKYKEYGLKIIRASGETNDDVPSFIKGQFDICLLTYEKFMALSLSNPHVLEQIGVVVIDEAQMITDKNRGANLEFLITMLNVRRKHGIAPQLITLSAVTGDTKGFERWIDGNLLKWTKRPVELVEGIIRTDGSFRYKDWKTGEEKTDSYIRPQYDKGSSQDWIIPLVRRLVGENKKVIVFREKKGETRGAAMYLSRELNLPTDTDTISKLPRNDDSILLDDLIASLEGGVAFHNSNLTKEERSIIEDSFRDKDSSLRVIVATTTLAMGINTPAEAVIVAGLEHPFTGPYSVAEYKNIIGRAGRLGYSEKGYSFLLATSPYKENQYWNDYVLNSPEDLYSHFITDTTDPRTMVLRILSTVKQGLEEEEIIDFLESSFGAFLNKQTNSTWKWDKNSFSNAISNLNQNDFIKEENLKYKLTSLGKLVGGSAIEVESAVRISHALSKIPNELNDINLIAISTLSVELDNVYLPINYKSTQKEPTEWANELRRQGISPILINELQSNLKSQFHFTERTKKAISALLYMSDLEMKQIEAILTKFGGNYDGASGPIRSVSSRISDVMPLIFDIANLIYPTTNISNAEEKLLARLDTGSSSDTVELAISLGTNLSRGDYRALKSNNIFNFNTLQTVSDDNLLVLLNNDVDKLSLIKNSVKDFLKKQTDVVIPEIPIHT